MIQILLFDDKVIKLDDSPGGAQTWLLGEDDDGNPEWIEIKNRTEEK